jgi:hypothetical protein
MRYVQIEFRPGGKRYTYEHAGDEPIEAGVDRVEVLTNDTGPCVFKVLAVSTEKPTYATKPVQRVMPRPAPAAAPAPGAM